MRDWNEESNPGSDANFWYELGQVTYSQGLGILNGVKSLSIALL